MALALLAGLAGPAGGRLHALGDLPLVHTRVLDMGNAETLTISYGHDDLILRESESEDLVIREYMNRDHSRYAARVSREGKTVRIRRGRRPWLNWNWEARAEISLPRSFRGNLRIAVAGGNLSADGDLADYKTVDITVSSGMALLKGVSGGTVSVHVSSGGLELGALGGSSFVSVSSGRLRINGIHGEEHHLKVSSGGLWVGALEGRSAFELSSGNITVDRLRGETGVRVSSGSLELGNVAGSGSFDMSSGNLRIHMEDLLADLRFKLSSGNVELEIPLAIPVTLDLKTSSGTVQVLEEGTETLRVSGSSTVLRPLGTLTRQTEAERTILARISSGNLMINRR
jgi:hypothetical protein